MPFNGDIYITPRVVNYEESTIHAIQRIAESNTTEVASCFSADCQVSPLELEMDGSTGPIP